MIAQPGDFIFNDFWPSIFGAAVGYIDELIFIKGINGDVFFLSHFHRSLLQACQFVTLVGLRFENFLVKESITEEGIEQKSIFFVGS